jgi:hypothetical protein
MTEKPSPTPTVAYSGVRPGQTDTPAAGRRAARRRRLIALSLILIGVAAHLPSLRWGFLYDDFIHQFMLGKIESSGPSRAWRLFDFGTRPSAGQPLFNWGFYPWWTDPDFKIRFFRPVASLSIAADHWLYGHWAPGYHATSIALFAGLLVLVYRLFRSLKLPDGAALWALAFMALNDVNALPVGWIANRNTLLATLFLVGMLLALHSNRRRPRTIKIVIAAICFLLACGSKESGIIGLPLAALHELLYPAKEGPLSLRARLSAMLKSPALWVVLACTCVYFAGYAIAGYGTRSLLYPTPWRSPGQFFGRLAAIGPLAGMSLLFGISADMISGLPQHMWWILAVAAVILLVVLRIMARTMTWTPAVGLALGLIIFSLLPEAGADPSDRLLLNASIGTSLLIGLFLYQLGSWRTLLAKRHLAPLALAAVLVFRGIILTLPSTWIRGWGFSKMGEYDRAFIAEADIDRQRPAPRNVFVLNSPTSLLAVTMMATWAVTHDDDGTRIHMMQMGRRGLEWHRQDGRRMTLTARGTAFGDQRFERLFCTGHPAQAGQVHYRTSAFTAIPLEVEPNGVRRVLLEFDHDLDDDAYQFLEWDRNQNCFIRIPPPRIGETVEIPEIPPPFALVP